MNSCISHDCLDQQKPIFPDHLIQFFYEGARATEPELNWDKLCFFILVSVSASRNCATEPSFSTRTVVLRGSASTLQPTHRTRMTGVGVSELRWVSCGQWPRPAVQAARRQVEDIGSLDCRLVDFAADGMTKKVVGLTLSIHGIRPMPFGTGELSLIRCSYDKLNI